MKNLKIKLGLFSLLAILAVSVFFTACQQEDIVDVMEEQASDVQDRVLLLMPHGFETLSEEEQIEYSGNLTEEDYTKLAENHRVGSYLRHIDKYWEIYESMEEGQLFSDIDLSNALTAEEVADLSNYQYDNIELRGCGSWSFSYSYYDYHSASIRICVFKRTCYGSWRCCWYQSSWNEYAHNTSCISPGII